MTPSGQTICLCMIVKNEAHVISRCLASARPLVDSWLIIDTGSTDGTQAVIREAMVDLPGELVERPWVDFSHNRSEALALARPLGDYSLIIDADDTFEVPPGFSMPVLDADFYKVDIQYGLTAYQRPQMVRNTLEWRYRGVLHEFLECPDAKTSGHLPIGMRIQKEGWRSTQADTYVKDAAILAKALETETDPFLVARYTFYLAQSYRDCGRHQQSLDFYLRRAELEYWQEEVYVSLYQAGRMAEVLKRPAEEVLAIYRRAMEATSTRAEAAHAASRFCRHLRRFAEGRAVAAPFLDRRAPAEGLFVEPWIYEYGLRDEFAVNAYWSGDYRGSLAAALGALESGKVPDAYRPRFLANMRFALDKLPASAEPLASTASPQVAGSPIVAPQMSAASARSEDPQPDVSIAALISCVEHAISIVDVGAALFGEKQLYQALLDRGLGHLTSFEPDPAKYDELTRIANSRDTILQMALGDGTAHALHLAPGGMTSIFEADQASYDLYDLFAKPPFSPVEASSRRVTIDTTRLDDVAALERIDLFKIDTQGAELMILQNGRAKLRDCSIVQIEMPFVRLYKDQPAFGDIDAELRSQGFMVHGFATIKRLPLHPYSMTGSLNGINQLIDLDMIYVRDLRRMQDIPSAVLRTTAVAADVCYGSFDLALRCLVELARRKSIEGSAPERYARAAAARRRVGMIHYTPFVD